MQPAGHTRTRRGPNVCPLSHNAVRMRVQGWLGGPALRCAAAVSRRLLRPRRQRVSPRAQPAPIGGGCTACCAGRGGSSHAARRRWPCKATPWPYAQLSDALADVSPDEVSDAYPNEPPDEVSDAYPNEPPDE